MSSESKLQQRLADLEHAVAELQRQMATKFQTGDWLDRVIGSFKDEPAFDEVLKYGRQLREADRPDEDDAP